LIGLFAGGCLAPDAKLCNNGLTCPESKACDEMHGGCVEPQQLTACDGLVRGDDCGIDGTDDGTCDMGVCLVKRCGDGFRRGNEACDGDEIMEGVECSDLGFYDTGVVPTCNDACSLDVDPATTVCTGYCGDGMLTPGVEVCEADVPLTSTCLDFGFITGGLECNDCRPYQRDCIPFGWQLRYFGGTVLDVHATGADDVWALLVDNFTYANTIVHFDGTTWSPVDLSACALDPMTEYLFDIWSPEKGVLFAEGGEALVRIMGTTCEKFHLPDPDNLSAVWASGPNDAWVATLDSVYQFDGTSFNLKLTLAPEDGNPWQIWGSGPSDVWVVLNGAFHSHRLAHYDGTTWQNGIDPGIPDAMSMWGTSSSDVYVGDGYSPQVAHYNGTSWSPLPSPPVASIFRGSAASDGKVYVSAYGGVVAMYDGVSWTDMGAPASGELWAGPGGDVWLATGASGAVARFTGSGHVATTSNTYRQALAVKTTTEAYSLTYVPGPSGDLQLEHWDGTTWQIDSAVPAPGDVTYTPTGKVMAVAWHNLSGSANNGLWIRDLNGAWSHPANVDEGLNLSVVADDNVWILNFGNVTYAATVMHWTSPSSVTTFGIQKPVGAFVNASYADIWAFSNTNIYVVGSSQTNGVNTPIVMHSNGDSTAAWTSETIQLTNDSLDKIWAHSPTDLYAISHLGKLIHSTGNGTWEVMDTPPGLKVYDVYGAPDDLFIATDNQLWRFDGVRWEPVSLDAPVIARQVMTVGSVIVALDIAGRLHRIVRLVPW
jgi:hypothetical protein